MLPTRLCGSVMPCNGNFPWKSVFSGLTWADMRELSLPATRLITRLVLFLTLTVWLVNQWWEVRVDGQGYILRVTHDGWGMYRVGRGSDWSIQVKRTSRSYFHRGFAPRPVMFTDQPLDQVFFCDLPGLLGWRFKQLPSIWFFGIRHWFLVCCAALLHAMLTLFSHRLQKKLAVPGSIAHQSSEQHRSATLCSGTRGDPEKGRVDE